MAKPRPLCDFDWQVLAALRAGDARPMNIVDVYDAVGQPDGGFDQLAAALHRLQGHGLSEVYLLPGELAAYHRCTVTTVEVIPIDLDALTGAAPWPT